MNNAKQVLGDRLRSLPAQFRLSSIRANAPGAFVATLGSDAARQRVAKARRAMPLIAIGLTGVAVLALATVLYAPLQAPSSDIADADEAAGTLAAEASAAPAIRTMTASLGTAPVPLGDEAAPPAAAVSEFEWSGSRPASDADDFTASIPDPELVEAVASTSDRVAVAESDLEIAALEEAQQREVAAVLDEVRRDGESYFSEMSSETAEPAAIASGPGRPARTTQFVNMRATADNDAEILSVVPANTAIEVTDDCPNWCAVTHEGQAGFIYNSFLDVEEGASVQAAAPAIQP